MPEIVSDVALKKLPPRHLEAEQSVLGACLKSKEAFAKALEVLNEDDFYSSGHKKIFVVMGELFAANEEIDLLIVAERLRKKGELEAAGGLEYLDKLDDTVPTFAAVTHHAKIVREKTILRDLINAATAIVAESYDESEEVDTLLDRAENAIFQISEKRSKPSFSKIKDVVKSGFASLERLFEKPGLVTGVETGFTDFDRILAGLQPSDLIIIAARPSMGKTSFALDIARFAAIRRGVPTGIFSLEMSKEQIGLRLLCAEAKDGVDLSKLRTGHLSKTDWPKLTAAGGRLSDAPIFIDDSASLSSLEVRARARRLYAEHNLGLLIIDYLQLMQSGFKAENRQLEISEISRGLKALAKDLNIPIVALSQLSRAVENRTDKRPLLADLRESGAIEQDADVVAFIYRDEVYNKEGPPGVAEILIRKQRNGPIGDLKLVFEKEYARFVNHSDLQAPPEYLQPQPAD